jgi:ribosomal-protein-alanine N-acetyltransferase
LEPLKVLLRPFKIADLDQVHEIEKHSFPKPWPKFSFVIFHYREPDGFQVATSNEQIVGYAIIETERARIAPYERTAHLANLAIHTDFRQRGIGRRLVENMIAYAKNMNVREITLEVSIHNGVARNLYSKFGFVEKKTIRGYYGNKEDAILMTKMC